jgi:LytTr DNA-binding domain
MNFLRRHIQAADDSGVEPARDRNNSGRGEANTPGTNGGNQVTNGGRRGIYAIVAAVAFAFALVNAFSAAHDAVRRGGSYDLGLPLLWELTSAVVIVALAPLIDFGVGGICRETRWPARVFWAAGTILVFSALHIAGMVALRKLALATVGGSYRFGFSISELVYELRKDAVTCFMIGTAFWLTNNRRDAPAKKAAESISPAANSPRVLWLRDGTARIRIEPSDIVAVSSAGNYVEYVLSGGRNHLVRGTLASEEARLTRFNIVRVHRTRLVNLSRVTALKAGPNGDFELTLDTGQTISGSRRHRGAVSSIEAPAAIAAAVPNGNQPHP